MQQELISLFSTPVLTGFVGYFTNFLAIKMLFRPYEKRWYSFGWQGVIPKNREKLAYEIGKLVGNELFTEKELKKAINDDSFQYVLEHTVESELKKFLQKDYGCLSDIFQSLGINLNEMIFLFVNNSEVEKQFAEFINKNISNLLQRFGEKQLKDLPDAQELIIEAISNFFENEKIKNAVADEFVSFFNNAILSGKSLKDILSSSQVEKVKEKGKEFSEKLLDYVDNLLRDETVREKIIGKIIEVKNQYFGEGFFDQLKLGVLNIFLNEDTIREIVNKNLPEIVSSIKSDPDIKSKLDKIIEEKIQTFLETPFYKHAEKIGMENLYLGYTKFISWFKESFLSKSLKNKVIDKIEKFFEENENYTVKGVFESYGIGFDRLGEIITKNVNYNFNEVITSFVNNMQAIVGSIKINNIYKKIPKSTFLNIKITILDGINRILESNVDKIISSLKVDRLVEEKINSLELSKLEELVFSFMKDQFKWINILGFVLGFLFGAIQSFIFYFA